MMTALSARELDSLPTLADSPRSGSTLATTLRDTIPPTPVGTPGDSHIGRWFGDLRVVRKLAEGGMGSVYLAVNESTGEKAAVKILLPEFARNRNVVQRFFNEARAAQSIAHPGVVKIFAADYDSRGHAYLVMEYLEGETLHARLRRERCLSVDQSVTIARQIGEALAAAHERGVVHRDLKPGNIFLVPDPSAPGGERIKLLDFGVAKLVSIDKPLTCIGDLIGTPLYMAPEQCRARGDIDARADLYSLGCLLYAMLCGRPPFTSSQPTDVILAHIQAPIPPPRIFAADLPVELEAVILALLQKNPDRRPQTAREFLSLLAGPPAPAPVEAAPSPAVAPHGHYAAAWRRGLIIGVVGVAATLLGLAVILAF